MRNSISFAIMALCMTASPALAQTKPATPTPPAGACAQLMNEYDGASKDLAANYASSVGDNSAPRATLRAMEDANTLTAARIALDLMRDNRCPLPKIVPNYIWYLNDALTCTTDRMKAGAGQSPASCDRANWKRLTAQK